MDKESIDMLKRLLEPMKVEELKRRPKKSLTQEFTLQLKDLGIDCNESLIETMNSRWKRQAKDKDSDAIYFNTNDVKVLHFIVTTLTAHLLIDSIRDSTNDKKEKVLIDNSLFKSVVNKITLFQHSLMLRFGFKIADKDIRDDIFIKYGTVKADKNFSSNTLKHFEMRTALVGRLIQRLKRKYKMINIDNLSASTESQFIMIYNDCCITLKHSNERIGLTNKKIDKR